MLWNHKYFWYSGLFWNCLWFWAHIVLQPGSLFALLVGWLHGAGFLLGETFEQILVLLLNYFCNLQATFFGTLSCYLHNLCCQVFFKYITLKQWVVNCRFLYCYIITDHLGISTCLFYVIVIDLVWVTCLLQCITDCFMRSWKVIKKLLLYLDMGGHGDHSTKLFSHHKHFYIVDWPSFEVLWVLDWVLSTPLHSMYF